MTTTEQPAPCCDMHNRHCEPPGDLCCNQCTEIHHGVHSCADRYGLVVAGHHGTACVLDAEVSR